MRCLESHESAVAASQREGLRAPVDRDAVPHVLERDAFVPPLPLFRAAEGTLHAGTAAAEEGEYGMFPEGFGALVHQRRDPRCRRRSTNQSPIARTPATAATANTVMPSNSLRPRSPGARRDRRDGLQPVPADSRAHAPGALSRCVRGRARRARAHRSWSGCDAETMKLEIIGPVPFCPDPWRDGPGSVTAEERSDRLESE